MSKLLEIFGKGITIDSVELVWNWLAAQQPANPAQGNLDEQLGRVIELLSDRNFDQAEQVLRFYLFEKPDCPRGRVAAASICIQKNDLQGAIEQARSVYLRQPHNTMALYLIGFCCERLEQVDQAIEFYQDCLKFKRHLQLPRQRMAAIHLRNGRIDKAIEEYIVLTSEHQDDIESITLLGYLYLASGQYAQAVDAFNLAILSHPDNFNQDGKEDELTPLLEQGLYEQAFENIYSIMDQIGAMPDLYVQLGDICRHAGRVTEAISHYEAALRMQPNSLEATIKLGSQYLRDGHPGLAAEQFNKAAEINDEIIDAYAGLAIAQYLEGQSIESEQTLSLAASIHQNSILLFAETAALHLKSSLNQDQVQSDESLTRDDIIETFINGWRKKMSSTGPNADLYYKYGVLLMIRGQIKDAIHWFQRALSVNSTHYRSRIKLCLALREIDQNVEAFGILKESTVLPSAMLELHYQTALLFCDKPRFAKAMRHIQTNNTFHGLSSEDTRDYIEVVLENLGIVDRALSSWSRIEQTSMLALSISQQEQ